MQFRSLSLSLPHFQWSCFPPTPFLTQNDLVPEKEKKETERNKQWTKDYRKKKKRENEKKNETEEVEKKTMKQKKRKQRKGRDKYK